MSKSRLFSAPVVVAVMLSLPIALSSAPATYAQAINEATAGHPVVVAESLVPTAPSVEEEPTPASPIIKALIRLLPRQIGEWINADCACVKYANNRNIAQGKYTERQRIMNSDAWEWPSKLRALGFSENRIPRVGDVAVFPRYVLPEPGWTSGHVGFVYSGNYGGGYVQVELRGANQGGRGTHYGCDNVSYQLYPRQREGVVKFYRK